jgi:hypothetical protein
MHPYDVIFEFTRACDLRNIDEFEAAIQGVDINRIRNRGLTPLINAINNGGKERVKLLLEYGADPNISMDNGLTPLIVSINSCSENTNITKLLLDYGADLNFIPNSIHMGSPLMQAISYLHVHITKLLLDRGADISLTNNKGLTAYDIALAEIEFCKKNGLPYIRLLDIVKLLDDHINTIKSQQKLSFAKTHDKIHSIVGRDMDDGVFRKISEHLSNMKHVPSVHVRIQNENMDNIIQVLEVLFK